VQAGLGIMAGPGLITFVLVALITLAIGRTIGVAVNLFLWPPTRYRSAESGIHTLAGDLSALLADIHPSLRGHGFDEDRATECTHKTTGTPAGNTA